MTSSTRSGTLRDPAYAGPGAGVLAGGRPRPRSTRGRSGSTSRTPLGGLPRSSATQPIAPAHLLRDVPSTGSPTTRSAAAPVGIGPVRPDRARRPARRPRPRPSVPAAASPADGGRPDPPVRRPARDRRRPTHAPGLPGARLDADRVPFFDDRRARRGVPRRRARRRVGSPAASRRPARPPADRRAPALPATTLTTVILNQRPAHPELRDPAVRLALLEAIDRAPDRRARSGRGRRSPTRRSRRRPGRSTRASAGRSPTNAKRPPSADEGRLDKKDGKLRRPGQGRRTGSRS